MRIRYWRSYVCSSDLGFTQPRMHAMLKELAVAPESGRALLRAAHGRRELRATPYVDRSPQRAGEPVPLVPGSLAGDFTLGLHTGSAADRESVSQCLYFSVVACSF